MFFGTRYKTWSVRIERSVYSSGSHDGGRQED